MATTEIRHRASLKSEQANKTDDVLDNLNLRKNSIGKSNIREVAWNIYNDYFVRNKSSSSFMYKEDRLKIDLPIDIQEILDEQNEMKFEDSPYFVFDDVYNYVNGKLYNIYLSFRRDEEEFKKIEQIMFNIDFYEIKRISIQRLSNKII
jgi:hypothetical protein